MLLGPHKRARLAFNSPSFPAQPFSKRRPEERNMVALVARGLWRPKVVSKLEGLPKGHDEVTTYGDGGGIPIKMKSGPLTGWTVGGGKRSEVYGKT